MDLHFVNKYLNLAWPLAGDEIRCEIISQARSKAKSNNLDLPLNRTTANVVVPPSFSGTAPTFNFRLPGSGSYQFDAHLSLMSVPITVTFWCEMQIDQNAHTLIPHSSISTDPVGDFFDAIKHWKGDIQDSLNKNLNSYTGFFNTMRYIAAEAPLVPAPKLATPPTNIDLGADGAIDIFLVADNFTSSDMGEFRSFVTEFVAKMTTQANQVESEPFYSFRSVIRLWSLEMAAALPTDHSKAVTYYYNGILPTPPTPPDDNLWRVAIDNLAVLEAVGEKADQAGAKVVAFISKDAPTAPAHPRAMGMGNVVFLPFTIGTIDFDTSTLIHELGHTILGGLADEYVTGHDSTEEYMGPDPAEPNVTSIYPETKWSMLRNRPMPSWETRPIGDAVEGAMTYSKGLWRPVDDCKMKNNGSNVGFCAACRQMLTVRMVGPLKGEFLLEVTDIDTKAVQNIKLTESNSTLKGALNVNHAPATLKVRVIAAQLPQPWNLACSITSSYSGKTATTLSEDTCQFTGVNGDCLQITATTSCLFVAGVFPKGPYTIQLTLKAPATTPPAVNLPAPSGLKVTIDATKTSQPTRTCHFIAKENTPPGSSINFLIEYVAKGQTFTNQPTLQSGTYSTSPASCNVPADVWSGDWTFQACVQDSTGHRSPWSAACDFTVTVPKKKLPKPDPNDNR